MIKSNKLTKIVFCIIMFLFVMILIKFSVQAAPSVFSIPNIDIHVGNADSTQGTSSVLQILLLVVLITLAPSILLLFTCFTRITISLHFLRAAMGTQQMPPNQIMIGLAVFLTLFVMGPTFSEINEIAVKPYSAGEISQEEFIDQAMIPLRDFMFRQVESKDLKLFTDIANIESYNSKDDIPNTVLVPAFALGEITKGFKIGFMVYIPFIAIDMIVSSTLMAMGMMMLPPALISAPFKLLLFILVDGWNLVIEGLLKTFR